MSRFHTETNGPLPCFLRGCGAPVEPDSPIMCAHHWAQVPSRLRDAVTTADQKVGTHYHDATGPAFAKAWHSYINAANRARAAVVEGSNR